MTDTPRQRRTAASIVELIKMRLSEAEKAHVQAVSEARDLYERVCTIRAILADAEKNGSDDAE